MRKGKRNGGVMVGKEGQGFKAAPGPSTQISKIAQRGSGTISTGPALGSHVSDTEATPPMCVIKSLVSKMAASARRRLAGPDA